MHKTGSCEQHPLTARPCLCVQTLRTVDAPAGGVAERLGPSQMIHRTEFTRLLVDALQCLGHSTLASALETESVRAPPRGAP